MPKPPLNFSDAPVCTGCCQKAADILRGVIPFLVSHEDIARREAVPHLIKFVSAPAQRVGPVPFRPQPHGVNDGVRFEKLFVPGLRSAPITPSSVISTAFVPSATAIPYSGIFISKNAPCTPAAP